MALKKLVAGNWKMNGSLAALDEIKAIAAAAKANPGADVAIGVPATLITPAASAAPGFAIGVRIATGRMAARIPAACLLPC